MARFFEGFEQFRVAEDQTPTYFMKMAGYRTRGEIATGTGRIGLSAALYLDVSAFEREWAWDGDAVTIGFAVRQQHRGPLFAVMAGEGDSLAVPHTLFYTDPETGFVTIKNQDGSSEIGYVTPLPNRWYYYEITLLRAGRVATVRVNGKIDVAFDIDPAITAASSFRLVFNPFFLMARVEDDTKQFDDVYIQDGTPLGPIQITGRLPSGDRAREWIGSDEDPLYPHNRLVGIVPPEPSDRFIFTAENDKHDSFVASATLPDDGEILAQGVVALVRKATADPVSIIANVDSNTVTMSNISKAWEYRYALVSAEGYDKTSIEAAEFGVRSVI